MSDLNNNLEELKKGIAEYLFECPDWHENECIVQREDADADDAMCTCGLLDYVHEKIDRAYKAGVEAERKRCADIARNMFNVKTMQNIHEVDAGEAIAKAILNTGDI